MSPKESMEHLVDTETNGGYSPPYITIFRNGGFGARNVPKQVLGKEADNTI